ncbi:TPA: NUMOD4 domain-containing protein [Streptococcus suis]|uniref:NUMOD4 domain-containing protein n=1 Tax=Streptococcus suis TaxID=1307 RepID=UPI000CF6E83F|nr:NUMOD4 domain-containing protein [Streptococcus suis]NQN88038.1 hypothetical protein [Streptococcus suis]
MNIEIWKDVRGYEGYYMVSNKGRVKSCYTKKILKQQLKKTGYLQVVLYKDRKPKSWLVHRLVGIAFIPNPENKEQVNHIDEDKTNNCLENLEWLSPDENANFGTRNYRFSSKIKKRVIQMDLSGKVIKTFDSAIDAAKETGLKSQGIARAARGERKKYSGFKWKFLESG